jgi:hypothetical protein
MGRGEGRGEGRRSIGEKKYDGGFINSGLTVLQVWPKPETSITYINSTLTLSVCINT